MFVGLLSRPFVIRRFTFSAHRNSVCGFTHEFVYSSVRLLFVCSFVCSIFIPLSFGYILCHDGFTIQSCPFWKYLVFLKTLSLRSHRKIVINNYVLPLLFTEHILDSASRVQTYGCEGNILAQSMLPQISGLGKKTRTRLLSDTPQAADTMGSYYYHTITSSMKRSISTAIPIAPRPHAIQTTVHQYPGLLSSEKPIKLKRSFSVSCTWSKL